jgi:heme-degrading monooxygenase HmoA
MRTSIRTAAWAPTANTLSRTRTARSTGPDRREFTMILREWRGRASPLKAEAYPAHFRRNVLPELVGVPGFLGAQLGKRQIGDRIEFLVLTRWRDVSSIQGFAGREIDRAIVEPGALAALTDFDACLRHYEVIEDS